MAAAQPIHRVVDLLDSTKNILFGTAPEAAREALGRGDPEEIAAIDGHFAIVARDGVTVRMARTISRPMRYFLAKREDGPTLVVSDRIDAIHQWLGREGLGDQFHPSYTRMVPAHYLLELRLVGCPDPNPTCRRFFTPPDEPLAPDVQAIGERYVRALYDEITKWLRMIPERSPIGVCFSGGIDSGAVFLLTYHAMRSLGMNPGRLKAFTLAIEGSGDDLRQAREFLQAVDLELFLEPIEVSPNEINVQDTVAVMEDYHALDVEAAAVNRALLRGIRRAYPDWTYLLDGDGGDENLKDYAIEENPELTIRSVLSNRLLYQEGWGVDTVKHSLTYSGGQSRGYVRCYAPAAESGFSTLSPYTAPRVIAIAEAIPFVELTDWRHDRLYALKGAVVSRGVRAIAGIDMPIFDKRRFQRGAMEDNMYSDLFPRHPRAYRSMFHALYA